MRQLEKFVLLQTIDQLWKDHLLNMDHLKEGIGLRGYAQQNPLQEYQKEGFEMFEEMIGRIHADAVQKVFTVQAVREDDLAAPRAAAPPAAGADAHERRRRGAGAPARRAAGGEPRRRSAQGRPQRSRARAAAARSTRSATAREAGGRRAARRRGCGEGRGAAAPVRVPGFRFAGVACGLKESGKRDVALIVSDVPATAAGAFTTNRVQGGAGRARPASGCAAGRVQAILVNSGNANAYTGARRPGAWRAR